jgi:hypothetical protein
MLSESKQVGFVPLPRVGGALSHAAASIRNLPRRCQTGVCQTVVCQTSRFGKRGGRRKEKTAEVKHSVGKQQVCGMVGKLYLTGFRKGCPLFGITFYRSLLGVAFQRLPMIQ